MKRPMGLLVLGTLLGALAGFAIGIIFYPSLFPSLLATDAEARVLVASGAFRHADLKDPIHYGSGGVRLYSDLLHLEADFEVGPGPKYHVYLVPEDGVTPDTRVEESMFVDLGRLKAFSGRQNYRIPAGLDPTDYRTVVIWCEHFNVLISPAPLLFSSVER